MGLRPPLVSFVHPTLVADAAPPTAHLVPSAHFFPGPPASHPTVFLPPPTSGLPLRTAPTGGLARGFYGGPPTLPTAVVDRGALAGRGEPPISVLKRKTKLCLYHLAGNCPYGDRCNYAHSHEELRVDATGTAPGSSPDTNARFKTRMCKHWIASMATHCPHGIRCSYAHGQAELELYTSLAQARERRDLANVSELASTFRALSLHSGSPRVGGSGPAPWRLEAASCATAALAPPPPSWRPSLRGEGVSSSSSWMREIPGVISVPYTPAPAFTSHGSDDPGAPVARASDGREHAESGARAREERSGLGGGGGGGGVGLDGGSGRGGELGRAEHGLHAPPGFTGGRSIIPSLPFPAPRPSASSPEAGSFDAFDPALLGLSGFMVEDATRVRASPVAPVAPEADTTSSPTPDRALENVFGPSIWGPVGSASGTR